MKLSRLPIALSILSFAFLVSCTKLEESPANATRFIASIEEIKNGLRVKTGMTRDEEEDHYQVYWHKEDRIAVFSDKGSKSEFYISRMDRDAQKALFEGDLMSRVKVAIFPFSISRGKRNVIQIPALQVYQKNGVAPSALPMIAHYDDDEEELEFQHLAGVFSLRLCGNGEVVTHIRFMANEVITGTAMVHRVEDDYQMDFQEDGETSIVLDCMTEGGVRLSSEEKVFNIVLSPLSIRKYSIQVNTLEGQSMLITYNHLNSIVPHRATYVETPVLTFRNTKL